MLQPPKPACGRNIPIACCVPINGQISEEIILPSVPDYSGMGISGDDGWVSNETESCDRNSLSQVLGLDDRGLLLCCDLM